MTPDVALIGHPADYRHFTALVDRRGDKGVKLERHRALMEKMVDWTPSYVAGDPVALRLRGGRTLTARMIVCPFLPEALTGPREMKRAYDKIRAGTGLAEQLGCRFGALGGFSSIIDGQVGGSEAARTTRFTSGNQLTAVFAVRQVEVALAAVGAPLAERRVAIVGATGDIGRLAARLLAGHVRSILLVARFRPRLEALAAELAPYGSMIEVATEIAEVARADTVLLSAGARSAVTDETPFAPGSLVCDIGFPKNVSYSADPRSDIMVFSGGLAQLPEDAALEVYTQLPHPRLIFACYAEAIALAAHPDGAGLIAQQGDPIDLARTLAVEAGAKAAGIEPAPLWRGATRLDPQALDMPSLA